MNQKGFQPYPGFPFTTYKYFDTYSYVPIYAYSEALQLIAESVNSEREDELFYDYLLSVAPAAQKEIILAIRDDERKHNKLFRQLYWEVTGQEVPSAPEPTFEKPKTYCDGLTRALFGELAAVEKYRKILFGFEFLPYRNIITEIYTDELKHATKWNYLIAMNCR
ncbi:MAG: ferritin-like domain-containing protein [Syntrophomonadaceae bacterium]|nr:ferritin-like domain-containing protein [Syntrophomonadaceae bacterium]